jgi:FG-GAP-like repeat
MTNKNSRGRCLPEPRAAADPPAKDALKGRLQRVTLGLCAVMICAIACREFGVAPSASDGPGGFASSNGDSGAATLGGVPSGGKMPIGGDGIVGGGATANQGHAGALSSGGLGGDAAEAVADVAGGGGAAGDECAGISLWTDLKDVPEVPRDIPTTTLTHAVGWVLDRDNRVTCGGVLIAPDRMLLPPCAPFRNDLVELNPSNEPTAVGRFALSGLELREDGFTVAWLDSSADWAKFPSAPWSAELIHSGDRLRVVAAASDGHPIALASNVSPAALAEDAGQLAAPVGAERLWPAFADNGKFVAFCAVSACAIERCIQVATLEKASVTLRRYQAMAAQFWLDVTGDGFPEATIFDQAGVGVYDFEAAKPAVDWWRDMPYYGEQQNLVADVTGDGLGDALVVGPNIHVAPSTGVSFGTAVTFPGTVPSTPLQAGDVDGDGAQDLVALDKGALVVWRSTHSSFATPSPWGIVTCGGDCHLRLADVDGDGRSDAVIVGQNELQVALSSGTDFASPVTWLEEVAMGQRQWFFGDVTGDGAADAIVMDRNRTAVFVSLRSSFASAEQQWNAMPPLGERGNDVADVNDDGIADVIVQNHWGIDAYLSDGSGNFTRQNLLVGPFYGGL